MRRLSLLAILLADFAAFATPFGRTHWLDAARAFAAIFVGGLVFISLSLIPSWRRLDPKVYIESFSTLLPFADPLMPLLGASSLVLTLAAFARASHDSNAPPALGVAIAGIVCVFALSMATNVPINARVLRLQSSLSVAEIVHLRKKWAVFHWARTAVSLVALFALLGAHDGP
jgi:hypothetical protein